MGDHPDSVPAKEPGPAARSIELRQADEVPPGRELLPARLDSVVTLCAGRGPLVKIGTNA